MSRIKGLAHIGVAVRNLETALEIWGDKLGLVLEGVEEVESEGITVAHLRTPEGLTIELIAPTTSASSLEKFITKKGEGLHHLCFEVDDIGQLERELAAQGISFLPGYPREGSQQTIIAFVHPRSMAGVLVEFAQKKVKE